MTRPRRRQSGVALLITLILLSIITFIAVTFLLIARRERAQVTQAASMTVAETAAAAGRERAIAEILARIATSNDLLTLPVVCSTNMDITGPVAGFPSLQITNDPRAPVFLRNLAGLLEERFFLDLNRNRRPDPALPDALGDPEWIGVTEYPGQGHSGTNRFIYRYAFLVLPGGGMLDINVNHNQAKRRGVNDEAYLRNQGHGPWEINLAAFLHSLNSNYWTYVTYDTDPTAASFGTAFEDARDWVRYRLGFDYRTGQPSAEALYGPNAYKLGLDRLDTYGNGPVQLAADHFQTINLDNRPIGQDRPNESWPGGPSTNRFYTPGDLFDPTKTSPAFTNRLHAAGQNLPPQDGQLFYRLLSQLGTDTVPLKLTNFIHLNYDNVTTNLESLTEWDATTFFNLVADRLIRTRSNEFGFTITNILIWGPTGQTNLYSQELHQLLQMTANIYDATRNDVGIYPDYPTVFRPVFAKQGDLIYIVGYQEQKDDTVLNAPLRDLYSSTDRAALQPYDMVWGVPLIIGARKGYPNFNEFALQTYIQVTRKLEFRRPSTNSLPNQTNQMWVLGISNVMAVELWNSYASAFPRNLEMRATNFMMIVFTNELGYPNLPNGMPNPPVFTLAMGPTAIPAGSWGPGAFRIPLQTNLVFLPNSGYFTTGNRFLPIVPNPGFDRTPGFATPQWSLKIINKFLYALVDTASGTNRIVDYVNLQGLDSYIDITRELIANNDVLGEPSAIGSMWLTNRIGGNTLMHPPEGIFNQIEVCLGNRTVSAGDWRSYNDQPAQGMDKEKSIDTFRVFMGLQPLRYQRSQLPLSGLVQQSPFSPTRKLYVLTSWQANDPLVHYRVEDLMDPRGVTNQILVLKPPSLVPTNWNIGRLNTRYQPWGGNPQKDPSADPFAFDLRVKDPEVRKSDDWDFPHTKFANIGWLGRVHRGTPWQTIYLKSTAADEPTWRRWSGSRLPQVSHPTNDWRLVDLFTIAPHPEATRGLMPINQTNYAAWSAALSGILVAAPTNNGLVDVVIQPNSPELDAIYQGIINFRASLPRGRFERVSDILQVPELTVNSPYLNSAQQSVNPGPGQRSALSDLAYEMLPQKLLSLLRMEDARFVIYAWGQSLRPANASIQMTLAPNHPAYMLCTNYVVTGEVGTRTVVRIEDVSTTPGTVRPRAIIESFNFLPAE
ncbi:hypothetical protein NXS98_08070 [Fontisphaera persica]|uniref:hypothetical protein n=1 Tax=Fontisphaera persica TaxID=2974023 RepID=UPI0024BF8CEC|nr:hypothetical protein [Fontisphaera persica]WCJ61063.1 hypothetical protein NXS98_08070 [Fontisphaera persica]